MSLDVSHLTKRYAGRAVVHDVSFRVDDGELVALLGPSGSGKSTILRVIAGLAGAERGTVRVDGQDVTTLPPRERDLGFVFQHYALFEHLTVADNVEFALRVRKVNRPTRQRRRDELLELVGLGGSARKYPGQLSGGQRQRTALARALAHQPRLLLLDEPFGALDARIRQDLRQGLREVLKRIGTTAVFVTHDQEEAFSVADRIMVLHRGRLLEQGLPQQLYRAPRTEFVAGFVGRANLLPGELTPGGVRVRLEGDRPADDAIPQRVKVLLRPEELWLDEPDREPASAPGRFVREALVKRAEYLGASERVYLELDAIDPVQPEAGGRRYRIEALRSMEEARLMPVQPGDRVSVCARALHAVSQPDLRVLVLADATREGRALATALLHWGERQHALLTVLGGAVSDAQLRQPLEQFRQSFAGDLKLVDTGPTGLDLWQAARAHLDGERYDLVVLPASLAHGPRLLDLLAEGDLRHVLLAGDAPAAWPEGGHWSMLLRAFSSAQPELELPAEIAERLGARVEVRDLDGHLPPPAATAPPQRWRDALTLRRIPFTTLGTTATAKVDAGPGAALDPAAALTVLDLGPRAGLGPRQQTWIQALAGRWTWLIVQPDEADLGLAPTSSALHGRTAVPLAAQAALVDRNTP